MADGCNRLIRNVIICWNYLYISQGLAEEADEERRQALLTALENGSIVLGHPEPARRYDFSEEKLQDSVVGFDLLKIRRLTCFRDVSG
jgi:hypothetical protein